MQKLQLHQHIWPENTTIQKHIFTTSFAGTPHAFRNGHNFRRNRCIQQPTAFKTPRYNGQQLTHNTNRSIQSTKEQFTRNDKPQPQQHSKNRR